MSPARWLHSGATSDSVARTPTADDKNKRDAWLVEPGDVVDAYTLSSLERDPYSDDGGESWTIIGIDRECVLCRGTGQSGGSRCQKCDGEGWYDSTTNAAEPGA